MIVSVFQKELGYAPCRDERCSLDYVHPEHLIESRRTGRLPRTCPHCFAKIVEQRCVACGWQQTAPAPRKRHMTVDQVMRYTAVLRQVTVEDGTIILTEYRCPAHSRGGCSGRGWRKSKPCRVCSGKGFVTWTHEQMYNFLTTPAYAR